MANGRVWLLSSTQVDDTFEVTFWSGSPLIYYKNDLIITDDSRIFKIINAPDTAHDNNTGDFITIKNVNEEDTSQPPSGYVFAVETTSNYNIGRSSAIIDLDNTRNFYTTFFNHNANIVDNILPEDTNVLKKISYDADNSLPLWEGNPWPGGTGGGSVGGIGFTKFAVTGQSTLQSNTENDTMRVVAGTGIRLNTNVDLKTLTISTQGLFQPTIHGTTHAQHGSDPIPFVTQFMGGLMAPNDKIKLDTLPEASSLLFYKTIQVGVVPGQSGTSNNAIVNAVAGDVLKILAGRGVAINGDHSTKEISFSILGGTIQPAAHKLTHMVGGSDELLLNELAGNITASAHGNQVNGNLHALATTETHGFLSSSDKLKLNNATSSNVENTIVLRDSFGNFETRNITANRITINEELPYNDISFDTDFENINLRATTKKYVDKVRNDAFFVGNNYTKSISYKEPVVVATTSHLNCNRKINTWINASLEIPNLLKLTALAAGDIGNNISIIINNPILPSGVDSRSFSISVSSTHISITTARTRTGGVLTTGRDIVNAINNDPLAKNFVVASDGTNNKAYQYPQTYLQSGGALIDANILTSNVNSILTIDGITVSVGDRILVKDQLSGYRDMNGIYKVIDTGSISSPWLIERTDDFITGTDSLIPSKRVTTGCIVFVQKGNTNKNVGFMLETIEPITINASDLIFSAFTGSLSLNVGDGLYRAGRVLHVGGSSERIVVKPGQIDLYEIHDKDKTFVKPIVDKYGRTIGSGILEESDLPMLTVNKITGVWPIYMLPTGTSNNTVAIGDHNHHDWYLQKTGGTITGSLIIPATPTSNLDAVCKQWVENAIMNNVVAGNGLIKTGNDTLHIVGSSGRIEIEADHIDLARLHTVFSNKPSSAYIVSFDDFGRVTGWNQPGQKLPMDAIPDLPTSKITSGVFSTTFLPMYSETGSGPGSNVARGDHQHLIANPDGAGFVDKFIQASGATLVRGAIRSKITDHAFNDEFITKQWALNQIDVKDSQLLNGQTLTDKINTLISNALQYDEFADNVTINANLITLGTLSIDRLPMDPNNSGTYVAYTNHEHLINNVTYGEVEKYLLTNGSGMAYGPIKTNQSVFTFENEFISKKYVDDLVASVSGGEGTITFAGSGLYRDGNDIHVGGTSGRIVVSSDAVDLHALYAIAAPILQSMWPKVSIDRWGRVVSAELLNIDDIPSLPVSKITTGVFDLTRLPVDTGNTGSNTLLALGNHTHPQYFLKTGGNVTGPILMPSIYTPTNEDELITKKYVDGIVDVTEVVAGQGLVRNGNTLDVMGSSNRIIVNENNIDLFELYATGANAITQPWTKVSIDKWGRVIGVTGLTAEDIPDLPGSKIQSGKVGIDFLPTDDVNGSSLLLSRSNHTHDKNSILSVSWGVIENAPSFLLTSGGNITGSIFMPIDHVTTLSNELTTKKYVDNFIHPDVVLRTGSTMTGPLLLHTNMPSIANEAVSKQYVDNYVKGLDLKESVRAASITNLDASLNITTQLLTSNTNNNLIIDGINLDIDDRVLLRHQTDAKQNGIYVVVDYGSASSPWILKRADDFVQDTVTAGAFTFVEDGNVNKYNGFVLTTKNPVNINYDNITFTPFSMNTHVMSGNGLYSTGIEIHVGGTTNRITVNTDNIDIAANYEGQTSITKVGTLTEGVWNSTPIENNFITSQLNGKTYNGLTIDSNSTDNRFSFQCANNIIHFEGGFVGKLLLTNTSYVKLPETPDFNYVTLATDLLAVAPQGANPGRNGLLSAEDKAKLNAIGDGVSGSIGKINIVGMSDIQGPIEAATAGDTIVYNAGSGIDLKTDSMSKTLTISQRNYGSLTVPFMAGEQLYGYEMLALAPNGKVVKASSSNINHLGRVVGFYQNEIEVNDGDMIDVITMGLIEDSYSSFDAAIPVYVGLNGGLTQEEPISGFSQVIGYPISSTKIYMYLQPPIQK